MRTSKIYTNPAGNKSNSSIGSIGLSMLPSAKVITHTFYPWNTILMKYLILTISCSLWGAVKIIPRNSEASYFEWRPSYTAYILRGISYARHYSIASTLLRHWICFPFIISDIIRLFSNALNQSSNIWSSRANRMSIINWRNTILLRKFFKNKTIEAHLDSLMSGSWASPLKGYLPTPTFWATTPTIYSLHSTDTWSHRWWLPPPSGSKCLMSARHYANSEKPTK